MRGNIEKELANNPKERLRELRTQAQARTNQRLRESVQLRSVLALCGLNHQRACERASERARQKRGIEIAAHSEKHGYSARLENSDGGHVQSKAIEHSGEAIQYYNNNGCDACMRSNRPFHECVSISIAENDHEYTQTARMISPAAHNSSQ